jgi:hypothetical protein
MLSSKLLLATVLVPATLLSQGVGAGEPQREEIPRTRFVHVVVDQDVVLKPKFRGLTAMMGAGERWVVPVGDYSVRHELTIDDREYVLVPYVIHSWDGRTARNYRVSNSLGCVSEFEDFVVIDFETGEITPRTWKNADHSCGTKEVKRQGKWAEVVEVESPGAIHMTDQNIDRSNR